MSWYYVDASGKTIGPIPPKEMKTKLSTKEIKEDTYVWNGTTVNQWKRIKELPQSILLQIQPPPAPISKPDNNTRAIRQKAGRRGRACLLASIRTGAQLKKVSPPVESKPGRPSASASRPKTKLTLQEQMAMKLASRNAKGGSSSSIGSNGLRNNAISGGASKFGNKNARKWKENMQNNSVKRASPASVAKVPSNKWQQSAKKNLNNANSFNDKNKSKSMFGSYAVGGNRLSSGSGKSYNNSMSDNNRGGNSPRSVKSDESDLAFNIQSIKCKLASAQDWQIKAIAKILE